MFRWLLREAPTRSHSELGRETSQRRWYFILRCGRVGRCRFFFQAEDGIRDVERSRGLGDVYKRQL